jgi:hypothetical protein
MFGLQELADFAKFILLLNLNEENVLSICSEIWLFTNCSRRNSQFLDTPTKLRVAILLAVGSVPVNHRMAHAHGKSQLTYFDKC